MGAGVPPAGDETKAVHNGPSGSYRSRLHARHAVSYSAVWHSQSGKPTAPLSSRRIVYIDENDNRRDRLRQWVFTSQMWHLRGNVYSSIALISAFLRRKRVITRCVL